MTWESPEGVRYTVEVYDLTPREEKYWGFRDTRVEDALRWVESFISMAEYEEGAFRVGGGPGVRGQPPL
jgi:hypothetical protein